MSPVLVFLLAVAAPVTAPAPDPQARALELYDQGRFAEAAVEFERLAQSDPTQFFEAGQMRFAAGHMAHASRHFQAYMATGLGEDDRSIAQARLARATEGTRRVDVSLAPASVTQVVARRLGEPAGQERPELVTPVTGSAVTLELDPGTWELRVEAPGYVPLRREVVVGANNAPVTMRLAPVPVATSMPAQYVETAARKNELRRGRAMTAAGAVMLPLGVVALGGFVAVAVGHRRTGDEYRALGVDGYLCNDLGRLGELESRARRQAGAMVGLGVVSGALLTAGTVLLVRGQKTLRRARLSFDVRPDRAGLLLSGSF